jgi:hypothetical protein
MQARWSSFDGHRAFLLDRVMSKERRVERDRSVRIPPLMLGCLTVALCATLTGCVTTETRTGGTIIPPPANAPPPAFGSASQTRVSAIGVCSVPYDGFTLPLVSPDGRWLATQTGVPPTWPTLLAIAGQTPPRASAIEIWALDARGGWSVARSETGLMLGRSADVDGFLVEEVLDDGSRRIGRIDWPEANRDREADRPRDEAAPSLAIDWIIDDGRVNAFAALAVGADGRSIGSLAWCSRDIDGRGFALSTRDGATSAQWDLAPKPEQSWMLPVFSRDGRTLYAMRYRDGVVDLCAGDPSSVEAFEQSLLQRRLSNRMDLQRTYQTLAPQGTDAAVAPISPDSTNDGLLLFDPDLRRIVHWNPQLGTYRPLLDGSFAAALATDGSMLIADRDGLLLDRPDAPPGFPPRIYPRSAVPRHVRFMGDAPADWILLVSERRTISVVRFALLEATLTSSR